MALNLKIKFVSYYNFEQETTLLDIKSLLSVPFNCSDIIMMLASLKIASKLSPAEQSCRAHFGNIIIGFASFLPYFAYFAVQPLSGEFFGSTGSLPFLVNRVICSGMMNLIPINYAILNFSLRNIFGNQHDVASLSKNIYFGEQTSRVSQHRVLPLKQISKSRIASNQLFNITTIALSVMLFYYLCKTQSEKNPHGQITAFPLISCVLFFYNLLTTVIDDIKKKALSLNRYRLTESVEWRQARERKNQQDSVQEEKIDISSPVEGRGVFS